MRDLAAPREHARVHRPHTDADGPVVLWLHGGGWTFGGSDTHDRMSRRLAHATGAAVVTLDYRLAPEHRWPLAIDDTVDALEWLASSPDELGFTPTSVVVAGDSSGGALAALACVRMRDAGSEALPVGQVLVYADTDLTCDQPSTVEKGAGWGLDSDTVFFFNELWVPDRSRWRDPEVSALFTPDLTGLPPAVVVTAEHDPLRDQGADYASRLQRAGVPTVYRCEPGLVHNFMLLDEMSPASADAADRVAADIVDLFGRTRATGNRSA